MIARQLLERWHGPVLAGVIGGVLVSPLSGQAAVTTNVSVVSFSYNPPAVTINAGDTVKWNWSGSIHSSTSDAGNTLMWDSTIIASGSYSVIFPTAGSFPYHCTLHAGAPFFMKGSVAVQSANALPSVVINSPTNGTTVAAPWTGTIRATASDLDGTISRLDFYSGATLLGSLTNPPATANFTATNVAAGTHLLKAVATDNVGATNTSATVSISVVTPVSIVLSAFQRLSASAVQFHYSANTGLSYIVLRSAALPTFAPLSTNTATNSTATFLDNSASGAANYYRVQRVLNP